MELQKPLDPRARFCIVMCVDFEDQRTEESSCFKEWVTMIAALFWVKIVSTDVLEDQQNRESSHYRPFLLFTGFFCLQRVGHVISSSSLPITLLEHAHQSLKCKLWGLLNFKATSTQP
jgi:hypothetical protein